MTVCNRASDCCRPAFTRAGNESGTTGMVTVHANGGAACVAVAMPQVRNTRHSPRFLFLVLLLLQLQDHLRGDVDCHTSISNTMWPPLTSKSRLWFQEGQIAEAAGAGAAAPPQEDAVGVKDGEWRVPHEGLFSWFFCVDNLKSMKRWTPQAACHTADARVFCKNVLGPPFIDISSPAWRDSAAPVARIARFSPPRQDRVQHSCVIHFLARA